MRQAADAARRCERCWQDIDAADDVTVVDGADDDGVAEVVVDGTSGLDDPNQLYTHSNSNFQAKHLCNRPNCIVLVLYLWSMQYLH